MPEITEDQMKDYWEHDRQMRQKLLDSQVNNAMAGDRIARIEAMLEYLIEQLKKTGAIES